MSVERFANFRHLGAFVHEQLVIFRRHGKRDELLYLQLAGLDKARDLAGLVAHDHVEVHAVIRVACCVRSAVGGHDVIGAVGVDAVPLVTAILFGNILERSGGLGIEVGGKRRARFG